MTITLREGMEHCQGVLGIDEIAGRSWKQTFNDAGVAMTIAHGWRYLQRRSATIAITPDQDYVLIPTTVGKVTSIRSDDALVFHARPATPDEILSYRTSTASGGYETYHLCLGYLEQAGKVAAPIFEIFPTPGSNSSLSFAYFFEAGWRNVDGPDDVADIQWYAEPLFLEYLRLTAAAYNANMTSLVGVYDAIEASSIFKRATQQDGNLYSQLGPEHKGAGMQHGLAENWGAIEMGAPSGP
jgi:hypothetical protein